VPYVWRIAAAAFAFAVAVRAASLTVSIQNIPAEADNLAVKIDGGGLTDTVAVLQRLTAGQTTANVVATVPSGSYRVRALVYNYTTQRPLRSGRVLNASTSSPATLTLGDMFPPFLTNPPFNVARGSRVTLPYRVADPGAWLEGVAPKLATSGGSFAHARVAPVLSPSGTWEVTGTLYTSMASESVWCILNYEVPLPAGTNLPYLFWQSGSYYVSPATSSGLSLDVQNLPPQSSSVYLLADRGGIDGFLSATFSVAPGSNGSARIDVGLPPGGPYRIRVGALGAATASWNTRLLASGQASVLVPATGTPSASLALSPVALTLDPANPVSTPAGRFFTLSYTVQEPGGLLEGVLPALLTAPVMEQLGTVTQYAPVPFSKVGDNVWRGSVTMTESPGYEPGSVLLYRPAAYSVALVQYGSTELTSATGTLALSTAAGSCSPALPVSVMVPALGSTGTLAVAVPDGCTWSATANVPWISLTSASGIGPASIGYKIAPNFSAEYQSSSVSVGDKIVYFQQPPSTDPEDVRVVKHAYFHFLGRMPTTEEVAWHAAALAAGTSRTDLIDSFASSQEFQLGGRFIAGLYYGILNRDAEVSGWRYQRDALIAGQVSPSSLIDNFLNSLEYRLRFGTPDNPAFVRLLYRNILMREASQAEVDFQSAALNGGRMTRNSMTWAFLQSLEFSRLAGPRLTAFLAYATLGTRDGTDWEYREAAAEVAATGTQRVLLDKFANSREYIRHVN
jgi:hypothetical protein